MRPDVDPVAEADGRLRHYSDFYGLTEPVARERVVLVLGNCQAESLRIMLQGDDATTVRVPPVHELTARDMPFLERWLEAADLLVSQPVRDDYHGLPVGLRQTSARLGGRRGGLTIAVPVVRFAGLYPWHAIVRPPRDASIVPPVVEYHDLSTLAAAAGETLPPLVPATVRAVAEASIDELRRRESIWGTVVVSDLFERPGFELMRTMNHPGNAVWTALAERVRRRAGMRPTVHDPGRPLLDAVHAPRDAAVIDAWSLADEPTDHWLVGGAAVAVDEVRRAQLAWYTDNPDIVAAGIARHGSTLRLLRHSAVVRSR
ncbi:WcbI family polysaccharide biosynthesis putative acetyltransferase [Frondihabitans australicus]|uniref:Polysaccharide biosynthesis enzyme WcbI domain-containing protein n=1 Tax=Frondihabitans australicus TaxID=386892 RepID=A0A495IGM8_9MICO|nr:WcbI family polysaccharide biosynthesis putative acetyltransferase [Frondihabitans australicus]RKR74820.1 hypothetical protein C8E83_1951 [Frondihabitans australicus]